MDNASTIANHVKDKNRSTEFKRRRFAQWVENYTMYRDKIWLNRLTQRQAVNVPIVRESIETWISKIDEAPRLEFEARGRTNRDKDGEIIVNELWAYYFDYLKLELVDNLEKKVVGLTGRGFKKWGWANNQIFCDVLDPFDIDVDPSCNVLDLNTADFIIHKNIFRSLRSILANKNYSEEGKMELKTFLSSKEGIVFSSKMNESYVERQERLRQLGVENYDTNITSGDVVVEINESYKNVWNDKEKRFVRHIITIAADKSILKNTPMKEALGLSRLPIISWASDPDLNDIWSDGVADKTRTFNKIVNMYISQDIENRTYRNFGMYFYNTLDSKFQPSAFEPKPFGMYGVPGNPRDIVMQMDIQPLNDTANQITFLKNLIQSSVAQTPVERGDQQQGNTTLGEIQLSLQQSQGRNEVVSKNYRTAWKESGYIFYELLSFNSNGSIKLWKKGGDGNFYSKEVIPADWKLSLGYDCNVVLKAEKDALDDLNLKKLQYVKNSFQNNAKAQNIIRRKELELLDFPQEEIDSIMQVEEAAQMNPNAPTGQIVSQDNQQQAPTEPQIMQ